MHRPRPIAPFTLILAFIIVAPSLASAESSPWYPLETGSQWTYSDGTVTVTVEVAGEEILQGQIVHAVRYAVTGLSTSQPTAWTWYTRIDEAGLVRHLGCRPTGHDTWFEYAPAWAWLQLPPAVGSTWGKAELQVIFHPGKDSSPGSGWYLYSWDREGSVSTPAGTFTGYHSSHGWVSPLVGPVTFRLPPAYLYPGELPLVASNLVVPASETSWTALKDRFR
jgi:hypothetical protein